LIIDWQDVRGLSTSIKAYEESTLAILVTGKFSHLDTGGQMRSAVIYMKVLVDGEPSVPGEVLITVHDGISDIGVTHAFHYGGLQKGLHTVTVQWRNQGSAQGRLYDRVLEVFAIPQ
jgi:hypothetical protein